MPEKAADIPQYLADQYNRYQDHPCFPDLIGELGSILTRLCTPDEFMLFCRLARDPEPVLNAMLRDCISLIDIRDYSQAMDSIRYLLPIGQIPWPEADGKQESRSFRDLIEYTYYEVVCEPEREVVIRPFLPTDILYQFGRILSGKGEYQEALTMLGIAKRQSPVHAGILGAIVLAMIRTDQADQISDLLARSFRCAWTRQDLSLAYRNQGYLFSLQEDWDGAVACYLIARAWEESPEGVEELRSLAEYIGREIDEGYYNDHGREILTARNVPFGPDPDIIALLEQIADEYLEEQNLLAAREYLIRAHHLLMSDRLEERIWRVERYIEDQVDF